MTWTDSNLRLYDFLLLSLVMQYIWQPTFQSLPGVTVRASMPVTLQTRPAIPGTRVSVVQQTPLAHSQGVCMGIKMIINVYIIYMVPFIYI